ncbi:Uncharacterised protein [Mycobacteroides abscessus subsp. bolletii]|uniref:hypothetical protein n=1 Tax=Mycobacteroides abscessus TaxID=36809 RepID=UPI00092BC25D|nr:hypothetical protein [Mycobacteroides abscessus]SHX61560.1 Uncharacterised protein [Mycobacteroides abscessus subsp. bolletii]SKP57486.1 Uncharacterised protein [Mycobacteroides abscessus subsp. bolletii]SKP80723.1 Uncharacterised protein [Mycobacteroides abscessus subsp. bolletii]SKQ16366.1 Uncharacterised protein [Mycobacteroides abscessus subsp. bolletii]
MKIIPTAADVPLPMGADPGEMDDWQVNPDGSRYRFVWSPQFGPERLEIRSVVCQYGDGSIAPDGGEQAPEIWIGGEIYDIASAYQAANAIIQAVTQAVQWAGGLAR